MSDSRDSPDSPVNLFSSSVPSPDYDRLSHAGFVKLPEWTWIDISGNDCTSFLNNFCTADIQRLVAGQGCEAFLLNVKGKVLAHVIVLASQGRLLLASVPGQAEAIATHLDRYIIREDVRIYDASTTVTTLLLAGEDAPLRANKLLAASLPGNLYSHQAIYWGDVPVLACRVPLAKVPCWLLQTAQETASRLIDGLEQNNLPRCEFAAFEQRRLEAGWPWYGRDITADNLPQEVDRNSRAINFTKGCYLGQETVARIDALGHVNELLRAITVESADVPPPGTPVQAQEDDKSNGTQAGGKEVGKITSAAFSPQHGKPLALAYIRRQYSEPGTRVTVSDSPGVVRFCGNEA